MGLDFLILYEHVSREYESICLLKYELERRGYTADIRQLLDTKKLKYFTWRKPKVLVASAMYDDKTMNSFLRQMGIPFTVIATKADKISRGARSKQLAPICRALLVQPWEIICFSGEDGTGREELLSKIEEVLTGTQP